MIITMIAADSGSPAAAPCPTAGATATLPGQPEPARAPGPAARRLRLTWGTGWGTGSVQTLAGHRRACAAVAVSNGRTRNQLGLPTNSTSKKNRVILY